MNPVKDYLMEYEILEPFEKSYEDDTGTILSIRLNKKEKEILKHSMKLLQCRWRATVIKQLFKIGYDTITLPYMERALGFRNKNQRLNKLNGYDEVVINEPSKKNIKKKPTPNSGGDIVLNEDNEQ